MTPKSSCRWWCGGYTWFCSPPAGMPAGAGARRRLRWVRASLDSVIGGGPEIVGQVKAVCGDARRVGALHADLEALVRGALAPAKWVRSESSIGSSAVSVASAAVDLAKEISGWP